MNSFKDFYNSKAYFLTKNESLGIKGRNNKPAKFPTKAYFVQTWKTYRISQIQYILYLADLKKDEGNIKNYDKIKRAYDRWPIEYFVIYYGADANWACNLFVGEALFGAGYKQMYGDKYYSTKQIWNAEGGFKIVDKKNVQRGDIAAFGGHHVEIVTKVNRGQKFFDDDFCSRGDGRGSSDFGTEKCEGIFGNSREINNDEIRFLTIK
jgi:hypothetical protein